MNLGRIINSFTSTAVEKVLNQVDFSKADFSKVGNNLADAASQAIAKTDMSKPAANLTEAIDPSKVLSKISDTTSTTRLFGADALANQNKAMAKLSTGVKIQYNPSMRAHQG